MRSKLSLFLALAMAFTIMGFSGSAGGADELSIADLGTTASGEPTAISPVGGIVLYTATFTNNGPSPAQALLTDATSGGGTYVAALSDVEDCAAPADGTVNPVITCDRLMTSGQSLTIEVAVRTPAETTFVTNTATASVDPSLLNVLVDRNPGNDKAEVTTKVWNDPTESAALVKEGESISFKGHIVKVTKAENGVVIRLADALGGGDVCGPSLCGNGLHLGFGTDLDRQGMLEVQLNFTSDPCRGLGAEKCTAVYERKNSGQLNETITTVPSCATTPDLSKTCVMKVEKVGSNFRHTLRMNSVDPDLLPPLSV